MAKTKTTKQTIRPKQKPAGDIEVTVCRRRGGRRQAEAKTAKTTNSDAKETEVQEMATETELVVPAPVERRKVQRRRQIDPTTCERDYTDDEIEFMHALDAYKRSSGRMFPTCSEILEVVRGLGYERVGAGGEDTAKEPAMESESAELVEAGADQTS